MFYGQSVKALTHKSTGTSLNRHFSRILMRKCSYIKYINIFQNINVKLNELNLINNFQDKRQLSVG